MRLLPWRATQPQDASDQAKLDERLASLTKPAVQQAAPTTPVAAKASISPARAKLQGLTAGAAATQAAATQAAAPVVPASTETKPPVQNAVPATAAVTAELMAAAANPALIAEPVAAAPTPHAIAQPAQHRP